MLTIRKISSSTGAVKYYAEYAQEKGESVGKFIDQTSALGIDGQDVTYKAMERLLNGLPPDAKAPNGETQLCRNPGEEHTPGWDLTFSAPKSVSIAWSNADDSFRAEIEQAHELAVKASLDFIAREAGFTRSGRGGAKVERADLVFGTFQHSSSRAEEPQLHTHSILFNVARTKSDGKWRTLHVRPVYRAYMAGGAIYKAELAHQMQRLGFETKKTENSFELTAVPKAVCDAQSSRSKQLEEMLKEKGLTRAQTTARAKEIMTLDSRSGKDRVVRDFERWSQENAQHGFGPEEQAALLRDRKDRREPASPHEEKELADDALRALTAQDSTFNLYQLYRTVAEAAISSQGASSVERSIDLARKSRELLTLGKDMKDEERYSTREMYKIERAVMSAVEERRGENKHRVTPRSIDEALANRPTIKAEQETALRHIVAGKDGVTFIEGDAGTGKSFLMGAVREVYEKSGYNMIGVSFTNKAAMSLAEGSGIKNCRSVDSFLHACRTNPNYIPPRSVIVLDEAGMLDSRKTLELLQLAATRGAKVVSVGDEKQIQPITAGQVFGTLKKAFGSERLSDIVRQRITWERNAIRDLAEGRTLEGLRAFALQDGPSRPGQLHIVENRHDARGAIIVEWEKTALRSPDKAPLMVVSTNAEVTTLNLMARERLVAAGKIAEGHDIKTAHGTFHFAAGDQIVFTGNFKSKGIYNSTLARIEKINPLTKTLTVKTETGHRLRFNPKTVNHFRHGYAITAHKSQGSTVDRVLVMVDGYYMDREKIYVAMSRGRAGSTLFADKSTIGELSYEQRQAIKAKPESERQAAEREAYLANLAGLVGISHKKDTTHDYSAARDAFRRGVDLSRSSGRMLADLGAGLARQLERIADALRGAAPAHEADRGIGVTAAAAKGPEAAPAPERERDEGIER